MVTLAVNGQRICVGPDVPPSTRLIEFLRSATRFRGPKLACGEGGCGACAVLCDSFDPVTGDVTRRTLNSCLATLGSLDGASITTAEGLGNSKDGFHPIQDALAKNFASQCGFCTPGITVALAAAAGAAAAGDRPQHSSGASPPSAAALAQGLDGNLCRCTGWRPIIDTCRDVADMEDLCSSSSSSKAACSNTAGGSCKATPGSTGCCAAAYQLPPFPEWLKQHVIARQQQQQQWIAAPVGISTHPPSSSSSNSSSTTTYHTAGVEPGDRQSWLSPTSLQQLAGALRAHGTGAQLLAGNTGSGVYKELWPHDTPVVISTHAVTEMTAISHQAHGVILGGAVTLQQLLSVLRAPAAAAARVSHTAAANSSSSSSHGSTRAAPASTAKAWGAMADHVERIAGVPVRSAATLGGHFGLADIRPLPTDLGLLLAAAGAQLQVMTVHTHNSTGHQQQHQQQQWGWGGHQEQQWQQQQQQQQHDSGPLDLKWMSVEAFLADSAVGTHPPAAADTAASSNGGSNAASRHEACLLRTDGNSSMSEQHITADAIAGANMLPPTPQQQQQQGRAHNSHPDSAAAAAAAAGHSSGSKTIRVVTAVWLPYADDSCERFWSYKLSWRQVNSHAFVNMAVWIRFDSSSSSSSSPNRSSTGLHDVGSRSGELVEAVVGQSDPLCAGRRVSSVRLFVGCPPRTHSAAAGTAAAAAGAAGVAGPAAADEEHWVVLRVTEVEAALQGSEVNLQVLISSLRQLESQLQQQVCVSPLSFTSQALQGILFKALVPLIDTHSLTNKRQAAAGRGAGGAATANSSSSSSSSAGSNPRLLRLLQLPAAYDPKVLPTGRQVLPPPPGVQQQLLQRLQQQQQQRASDREQQQQQCPRDHQDMQQQSNGPDQLHLVSCHPRAATPSARTDGNTPHHTTGSGGTSCQSAVSAAAAAAAAVSGCVGAASAVGPLPLHLPVEKDAVRLQASGEAQYTADVAAALGGSNLYLAGVRSSRALSALLHVDASAALVLPGVVACFTARDIPGSNRVFGEPLMADGKVEYVGQLIALVAATSQTAADRAAKRVQVAYQDLPGHSPVLTLDDAIAADAFYGNAAFKAAAVAASPPGAADIQITHDSPHAAVAADATSADGPGGGTTNNTGAVAQDVPGSSPASRVAALIAAAPLRLQGQYDLPAQQHMYMETQTALAAPREDGCVRVWSATQSLDAVQQAVADVLGVSFNQVEVVARRLGGGFGGKASRSMPVAAAAAVAATLLQRPVVYSLNKNEDLAVNGGRCAGRLQYEAGFKPDGKIVAIQAKVIFRAGAYLDLASNDGAALVNASDSAYNLAGLAVEVRFARCNLPPHTIMRGPGYLQGCMVMEQILEHVAAVLEKDSAEVKAANFLPEVSQAALDSSSSNGGSSSSSSCSSTSVTDIDPLSSFPDGLTAQATRALGSDKDQHGQQHQQQQQQTRVLVQQQEQQQQQHVVTTLGRVIAAESYTLPRLWRELLASSGYTQRLQAVQQHNTQHAWSKRGIVVTPVRFDCAPAAVSASLSVYTDGSVLVNHGGIEMGQGLATKVKQAAVAALSQLLPESQRPLPLSVVRLSAASSAINPNGGPTWSSTGSEGNCQAVMDAAAKVVGRLRPALKVCDDGLATWQATVAAQFSDVGFAPSAVLLSAYGYFDGTLSSNGASTADSSSSSPTGCTSTSSSSTRGSSSSSSRSVGSGARQAVQYSAFGAAVTEVELDLLTGERRVLSTHIAYDCGYSLNPRIDLGQVEGAFVMGLGAMLCEEVVVDPTTGVLKSDSTWTYKIPTPDLIPQNFTVSFLADAPNPAGIAGSKASGEPALMTATSALLALQQAVGAAAEELKRLQAGGSDSNSDAVTVRGNGGVHRWKVLSAPATPQRVKGVMGHFSIADALQAAAE